MFRAYCFSGDGAEERVDAEVLFWEAPFEEVFFTGILFGVDPPIFVLDEMPEPGIPRFRYVPLFPELTEKPLTPVLRLIPDLEKFIRAPFPSLTVFLKRILIVVPIPFYNVDRITSWDLVL